MKILPSILISAASGLYSWSEVIDTEPAKNGFFNLEYKIETAGTEVLFSWSGSSTSTGTFTPSATAIVSGVTSTGGPNSDGRYFKSFSPSIFPFIKIGAIATGTTASMNVALLME